MFGILRTLLAVYVIFSIPTLGNYVVTFFFVLSGFLMTYIMQNTYHYNFSGVKLFWINRFLRLYQPIGLFSIYLSHYLISALDIKIDQYKKKHFQIN